MSAAARGGVGFNGGCTVEELHAWAVKEPATARELQPPIPCSLRRGGAWTAPGGGGLGLALQGSEQRRAAWTMRISGAARPPSRVVITRDEVLCSTVAATTGEDTNRYRGKETAVMKESAFNFIDFRRQSMNEVQAMTSVKRMLMYELRISEAVFSSNLLRLICLHVTRWFGLFVRRGYMHPTQVTLSLQLFSTGQLDSSCTGSNTKDLVRFLSGLPRSRAVPAKSEALFEISK